MPQRPQKASITQHGNERIVDVAKNPHDKTDWTLPRHHHHEYLRASRTGRFAWPAPLKPGYDSRMPVRFVRSEIDIDTSIDVVWGIMTAIDLYSAWNPFIVDVQAPNGPPIAATLMHFDVRWQQGGRARSSERVTLFEPPKADPEGTLRAEWRYDFVSPLSTIGMIQASRIQRLSQSPGQQTHYYSEERFAGWGTLFVPIQKVQAGFHAQAHALKAHAESPG